MREFSITSSLTSSAKRLPGGPWETVDGGLLMYRAIAEHLPRGAIFVVDHRRHPGRQRLPARLERGRPGTGARTGRPRLRAVAALHEADRRKDRFLAVLAHELRNPLSVAQQGVTLLRQPEPRMSPTRVVDLMEQQLVHMGRLIEDVLDVSYICHAHISLRPQRLALREVVEAAIEDALALDGDSTRLAQAIGNILTNAMKCTPAGGTVRVRASREGARALIRVADDGPGMSAATLSQLFDLFARGGDGASAQHPGGLGVGMWITRQLVEAHGGSVSAASAGLGQGSEFTIALPLTVPLPLAAGG